MASRILYYVFSIFKKDTRIPFAFRPQGASAPIVDGTFNPAIKSIARTGAGAFLVTFTDSWPRLIAFLPGVRLAAVADITVQAGTYTPATQTAPATLVITTLTAATPTDVAANANNVISCEAIFTNSQSEV